MIQETADGAARPATTAAAQPPPWDARRGVIRIVVSLAVFFVAMALLARLFGPQLEAAGKSFVDHFGFAGLALGIFVADAFSLPPPPLFYILIVATGPGSHLVGMAVICAASIVAGNVGYRLSSVLATRPFFRRRIDATRARMDRLFARYGFWAFVIASFTPMPFSIMCYVAGVYRIGPRMFALVCVSRIPRLLVMYWMVVAGWMTGSA
jgi:membrane protein YqaA with SNARE-associated domain